MVPTAAGPATHYELFGRLRDASVSYLVTGAAALVLHGVPRLTADVDLAVDPGPENVARLERLLASWGYGEIGTVVRTSGDAVVRRLRHPLSALAEIDVVLPAPGNFARLQQGAAVVTLVDVPIPILGAADLRALKEQTGTDGDREDAAALATLASIRAGDRSDDADTRREQIRKFSRWSVAARLDWLLSAARLAKGLSPEARPMTRGLTRRHGWYGRR
jgi:hypothetical protein